MKTMRMVRCTSRFTKTYNALLNPFLRPAPSESTNTDSDSSDSDSEDGDEIPPSKLNGKGEMLDFDEDEDAGQAVTSDNPLRTKNELVEADIVIPEIQEVEPFETLEKVGEVMSIVGQVAIVVGSPSHIATRANEKALDSDTLLVFNDRKVFGYVSQSSFLITRAAEKL